MTDRADHMLSPADRRQRNRAEMRGAILDAARQIMREQGAAALNLNEVARRVGVKPPSLYEYFPGKAALYDALFRLGVELFAAEMERVIVRDNDPWQQMGAAMEMYMRFAQQHPELWSLIFERPVPGFQPWEESMAMSVQTLRRGQEMMRGFVESGEMRPGLSAEQATDFFDAVMHGLTAAHMANQPDLPAGSGRFGSLIPAAVRFFRAAWGTQAQEGKGERDDADDGSN